MGKLIFGIKNYELPSNSFVIKMSDRINGKLELLQDMQLKLKFPWYFGHNWDAAEECLRDFSWINEKDIVIIYEKMPCLAPEDMKIFLEVMKYVAEFWHERDEHNLTIILPDNAMI
jgi:hypothetical protein